MKIVLASESQSRRRALDLLGLNYEVHASAIDKKAIRDSDPTALTKKLTEAKAWKVASGLKNSIVVSGDAVVAKEQKIFEKPRDKEEAAGFLHELSGELLPFRNFPRRDSLRNAKNARDGRNLRDQLSSA